MSWGGRADLAIQKFSMAFLYIAILFGVWTNPSDRSSGGYAFAQTSSKTDLLRAQNFGDQVPEEVLKNLEGQLLLQQEQDRQRELIEQEVRQTSQRIRTRLFELELFFAKLRDGVLLNECAEIPELDEKISDLISFKETMALSCSSLPATASDSNQLCATRKSESQIELDRLRDSRATLLKQCGIANTTEKPQQ